MMPVIGLALFVGAQFGFREITLIVGVHRNLAWITSIVSQTLILYTFAMLGFLKMGIISVVIIGWCCIFLKIFYLLKGKYAANFKEKHYFDIWMLVIGIFMVKILFNSPLIHYDNYSHWALIIKFLTYQGHLPASTDSIISFTSYPPATALFITSFTSWVGFSDGTMLIGQFLIIWASLYSVFGVLRDATRSLNGFIICFAISFTNIFNIAIRMNNLLVDYVMPLIAISGLAGIYIYRKSKKLQFTHTVLFSSMLLLTKNSATFFVIMMVLYLFYMLERNSYGHSVTQTLKYLVISIIAGVAAYLPFYWWQWHVKHTFTSVSKHQISVSSYRRQLTKEGMQNIYKIGHKFLEQIFSFNSLSTKGVLLINIILLIAWLTIKYLIGKRNNLFKVLVALDVVFVVYYFSVFAMYIVSMPFAEAIVLDGFERYLSSMIICNIFIAVMSIVVAMDYAMYEQRIEKRDLRAYRSIFTKTLYQTTSLVFMIFSVILMFSEINGIQYNNSIGQLELPVQMKKVAKPSTIYNHTKILVVDPHRDDVSNYYASYVTRYYFFSDRVVGQENFMMDEKTFKKTIEDYQYVVIPEWHRTFTTMVRKVYHQNLKTGLYIVTPNKLVRVNEISN